MPLPAKPAEKPTWATSAVNVTTPPIGKKTSGWLAADVPPPNWQNWLHYWIEQWRKWSEDGLDDHELRLDALEDVRKVAVSIWSFVENAAPFGRGNYLGVSGVLVSTVNTDVRWPLHLEEGTIVKRLRANAAAGGGGVARISLIREDLAGTKNLEILLPAFGPAFGFQETIVDSAPVALTEKWYIRMTTDATPGTSLEVRSLEIDYLVP